MICPVCGERAMVVDSRHTKDTVVRRRKCEKCKYVFYTSEKVDASARYLLSKLINYRKKE